MAEATDPIVAAGAVLWRPGAGGPEVALVHRPRYDDWSFPKGKAEEGEHILHAAVREVWEESGVRPVLGRRLSSLEYEKDGRPKHVHYWAAAARGDGDFTPHAEVDRVEWLPPDEAARRLTYDHDVTLLREFTGGPRRTTPYIVLRHTSAGDKRTWDGADLLRPLDSRGRTEATGLAETLSVYGPARVLSSATARCLETVLPYAVRAGVPIRTDRAFSMGAAEAAEEAGARFARLLAEETPTLVCTHGELVPEVICRAHEILQAPPPADPRGHAPCSE